MHIHSLWRAALAACVIAVAAAPSASAASVTSQLRVEADGHDIGPGWQYAHDSVTYDTSRSAACNGTGESGSITGPSALGPLVQGADYTRRLDPVQISDEFDFGLLVCGVGSFESSDTAFWLYKVDHVSPEVGGEQFPITSSGQRSSGYLRTGRPAPTPGTSCSCRWATGSSRPAALSRSRSWSTTRTVSPRRPRACGSWAAATR